MYEEPTLLITCRGATCGSINLTDPKSWVTGNSIAFNSLFNNVDALRQELSWTHYRLIIKLDDEKKRTFYIDECIKSNLSTRQLDPFTHHLRCHHNHYILFQNQLFHLFINWLNIYCSKKNIADIKLERVLIYLWLNLKNIVFK